MNWTTVLEQYGFQHLWNPEILVVCVVLIVIYAGFMGPWQKQVNEAEPVTMGQALCFFGGVLVLYIAQGSPLHVIGKSYLFSAHMFQMALMYMIVPPLLISGTPSWMLRAVVKSEKVRAFIVKCSHPMVTVFLFIGLFSLYHFPLIFDTVMANQILHYMYHTILFIGALLMWWPMVTYHSGPRTLTPLKKIGYILTGTVLITPVCALVIFAPSLMYETYMDAPQLFEHIHGRDDQQMGGILMKLIQEVAYMIALGVAFYHWVKSEKTEQRLDPLDDPLQDVNDEDNHVELNQHDTEAKAELTTATKNAGQKI